MGVTAADRRGASPLLIHVSVCHRNTEGRLAAKLLLPTPSIFPPPGPMMVRFPPCSSCPSNPRPTSMRRRLFTLSPKSNASLSPQILNSSTCPVGVMATERIVPPTFQESRTAWRSRGIVRRDSFLKMENEASSLFLKTFSPSTSPPPPRLLPTPCGDSPSPHLPSPRLSRPASSSLFCRRLEDGDDTNWW